MSNQISSLVGQQHRENVNQPSHRIRHVICHVAQTALRSIPLMTKQKLTGKILTSSDGGGVDWKLVVDQFNNVSRAFLYVSTLSEP